MPRLARAYQNVILVLGWAYLSVALLDWRSSDSIQYASFLILAVVASGLKAGWQTSKGSLSLSFFFVLLSLQLFTVSETYLMGMLSAMAGAFSHAPKGKRVHSAMFSSAVMSTAITLGYAASRMLLFDQPLLNEMGHLVLTAVLFFTGHTFSAASVSALARGISVRRHWRDSSYWMLGYYLIGSFIAGGFAWLSNFLGENGWRILVLALPVVYLVLRTYKLYLGRLEDDRLHAEEMASLHLRTIEALALAIDAKDQTTGEHLQRVQVYALGVGRELGLSDEDLNALHAASILHDIGKLAVPEHIISKPGKLTPEEFDKMKIHPVVGAEILERVQFPYPVVPIVRHHHEKWDGSGYPDGLVGEEIPLGARILAAVDCLDALASNRQYRKAMPLEEALGIVMKESGKAFDPRVVEVLVRRVHELEEQARAAHIEPLKLNTDFRVERGAAPATGFAPSELRTPELPAKEAPPRPAVGTAGPAADFRARIAAASAEAQTLYELAQGLGNTLSLDETFSVLGVRLSRMVPFDAMAVYLRRADKLVPEFVSGENFRLLASLEIPIGSGISGWVAENNKAIINGSANMEFAWMDDPNKTTSLRAALAVPLTGTGGAVGVLTLYRRELNGFSRDNLRILQAVNTKLALVVENNLRFRRAEASTTEDFLTRLPNARALFMQLDAELARCRRNHEPISLVVMDVDRFRRVNERYGSAGGDQVLQMMAASLKEGSREYDYVARMGGDEFVVVMPGLTPADLAGKLQIMRLRVQEAARQAVGADDLDASFGWACYPDDGTDAEDLLSEADKRLHKAKLQQRFDKDPRRNAPALELTAPITARVQ